MNNIFDPKYQLTPKITKGLMRIEACKSESSLLPLSSTVLSSLRETSKLYTTHYSTAIEGNRLSVEEVKSALKDKNDYQNRFPGRERDENEIRGYYLALSELEKQASNKTPVSEESIKMLHALVMSDGRTMVKPSPYRTGQNVIKDNKSGRIVYMPPEACDVPRLMKELTDWINEQSLKLPCPIIAAIAHYQFATIHPYYDGNGRTARLLTTLIIHLGGYDLKGIYSLEEYYARNLNRYYQAISIGPSHNYYLGRADSDITPWIDYFIEGMAIASEGVLAQLRSNQNNTISDHSLILRSLDPQQRIALTLLRQYEEITCKLLAEFLGVKSRTAASLCKKWTKSGFLQVANPSYKARSYSIGEKYRELVM